MGNGNDGVRARLRQLASRYAGRGGVYGADLAVLEATPAIAPELLPTDLSTPDPVAKAAASRTVLTHVHAYVLDQSTATLETTATEAGYELGEDFASYTI